MRNVFLLYGTDACNHFEQQVETWQKMLTPTEWEQCLFVLNTPIVALNLPMAILQERVIFCNSFDENAGKAIAIQAQDINDNTTIVALHCVCEAHQADLQADALVSFTNGFHQVCPLDVHMIWYLVLRYEPQYRQTQSAFATAILQTPHEHNWACYLLSNTTQHLNKIAPTTLRHMLHCELLLNMRTQRTLHSHEVYTLGYSPLNANGKELVQLEQDILVENCFLPNIEAIQNDARSIAWNLLTGDSNPPTNASIDQCMNRWLMHYENPSLWTFPNEALELNRQLGGCNDAQTNLFELEKQIERFFDLNLSTDALSKTVQDDLEKRFSYALTQPKALAFGCETVRQMLKDIRSWLLKKSKSDDKPLSTELTKKLLERIVPTRYLLRYCLAREHAYAAYAQIKVKKVIALALYEALQRFENFIPVVNDVQIHFESLRLPPTDQIRLRQKYPNHTTTLQNAYTLPEHMNKAVMCNDTALFSEQGAVCGEALTQLVVSCQQQRVDALPHIPSFFQILQTEYQTHDALLAFLDSYLCCGSKVLFELVSNNTSTPYYFADEAFETHPWYTAKAATQVVCSTSTNNVERLDRFSLGKSLESLLNLHNPTIFPWFTNDVDNFVAPLIHPLEVMPMQALVTPANDAPQQQKVSTAEKTYDMHMKVSNNHILSWIWPPHTESLKLTLESQDQVLINQYPVALPTSTCNLANQLGRTLPYGELFVTLQDVTNQYRQQVSLQGHCDQLRYQYQHQRNSTITLHIEGNTQHGEELLLLMTCGKREMLFPLLYSGERQFQKLPHHCQLVVNPNIPFPKIRLSKLA